MITLQLILITVVIVLALRIALSEGMLLENLGEYLESRAKKNKLFDLLGVCPWCSGTLFSIPAHFFAFGLGVIPFGWDWELLIRWPLVVFGCSFISGTLWTIVLTLNQIKDRNEQEKLYFESLNTPEEEKDNGKPE